MDILVIIRDYTSAFIFGLSDCIGFFIIRMGLMLAIMYGLLTLTLNLPVHAIFFQVCAVFLGIIISLNIPICAFKDTSPGRFATIVLFFFLCMLFLPNWLPALLVPRYGDQLKLQKILRWIVWGLFLIQIIAGWLQWMT